MFPRQIKLQSSEGLLISWDDGHESLISLQTLRDNCPCASCQGETILLKKYEPSPQKELPGKYKLTGAEQVGSYALQVIWADGHSTGLYTWDRLRSLCECRDCLEHK